ncbi:phosphoadenylyl-sulfate reductase [Nannocystis bainbridge]|uniref:Adenosine 5'-phosphosulfate reductase n=1 Tax=Nannocystis bainbridge TaxID=2995303 RepID=A0ABT5E2B5_9BACT|nr:phosphoadenylyl-sulfate reductase [Nannocystis bainbridge]MDC0719993.1 phosphoadenylyl-sulfate reductase [Nannocystis bainbridge]
MTERGSDPGSPGLAAASDTALAELAQRSAALEGQPAESILAWVFERWAGLRIGLSSAFGPEGCALIHLARAVRPDVPIYTIDTGYLFAETLAVREAFRAQGADIRVVEPLVTLRAQAERHGPDLFARDPDACCEIRKVEPMRRVLDRLDVWITAIRRDQASTRAGTPILGTARRADGGLVIKVAPLVAWTRKDTWRYLLDHDVPYNPLLDAGYTSIGCEPCTARPPGDDERGGRWSGTGKTECGIHHL